MNPFVVARLELTSPRPAEQALGALEQLHHDGLEAADRRYRLFGRRHGSYFSMSLGLPFFGGGAPVLRARAEQGAGTARFDVTVGARVELVVFTSFWLLLTVLGGGYQIFLQLSALAAGRATPNDVLEVLPGIGIMAGLLALGFWLYRRRATADAALLLDAFRRAVGAAGPGEMATPLH